MPKLFSQLIAPLRTALHNRLQQWYRKRLPSHDQVILTQRRIFIFPSGYGAIAQVLLWSLFIAGVNYANNMLLGMFFVIATISVLSLHLTYLQLSGLKIALQSLALTQAGEVYALTVQLSAAHKRKAQRIDMHWQYTQQQWQQFADAHQLSAQATDQPNTPYQHLTLYLQANQIDQQPQTFTFYLPAIERGIQALPCLRISCTYPFGWIRAWSYVYFAKQLTCAPALERCELSYSNADSLAEVDSTAVVQRYSDLSEFDQLKAYHESDLPKNIAWHQLAKGQALLTKHFINTADKPPVHIDYRTIDAISAEQCYRKIHFLTQQYATNNIAYSLVLPHNTLALNSGSTQLQRAQRLLAEAP